MPVGTGKEHYDNLASETVVARVQAELADVATFRRPMDVSECRDLPEAPYSVRLQNQCNACRGVRTARKVNLISLRCLRGTSFDRANL